MNNACLGKTMVPLALCVGLAMPALAAEAGQLAPNAIAPLALASRWAHILAAAVMLGGAVFLRFVLMPSVTEAFGPEGHAKLRPVLMPRWKRIVHVCIALFLVSGFYNYIVVTAPKHPGDALYHALFGVKFLLALAVFALASMIVSTREKVNPIRRKTPLWLAVTIALAVAVVLIGGVMKLR